MPVSYTRMCRELTMIHFHQLRYLNGLMQRSFLYLWVLVLDAAMLGLAALCSFRFGASFSSLVSRHIISGGLADVIGSPSGLSVIIAIALGFSELHRRFWKHVTDVLFFSVAATTGINLSTKYAIQIIAAFLHPGQPMCPLSLVVLTFADVFIVL